MLYLKIKWYWCAIRNILSISTKIHLRAHDTASSITNEWGGHFESTPFENMFQMRFSPSTVLILKEPLKRPVLCDCNALWVYIVSIQKKTRCDVLLLGYKFQGSRVYPEYKDNHVHFHFLKHVFSKFFFFFFTKRKTYKKFIYKQKKQGNMLALFTATSSLLLFFF